MIPINESKKMRLIDAAFDYWRDHGFIYPELRPHELLHELYKMHDTDLKISSPQSYLFEEMQETELEIRHNGINVPNHFHRHIWDSHASGMRSPIESFFDDVALRKAITLALESTGTLTDTAIRNKLKIVNGTQMCSNFRPSAAKAIYQRYWQGGKYILDPSAGYGGRLFGFIASEIDSHYVGVDPNELTCRANDNMASFFGYGDRVSCIPSPFEDAAKSGELWHAYAPFDMAFTSPPYFTKEVYSTDDTQSMIRYPEYDLWLDKFWSVVLREVYRMLSDGGYFIINIQDVKINSTTFPLVNDTLDYAVDSGFVLHEKLRMRFSGFGKGLDKFKSESVLVFRKR